MGQSQVTCRSMHGSMGSAEYFCRLLLKYWILAKYGHILGKTLCSGPRGQAGRQAHGGTALAPRHHVWCPCDFLGLINTSRMSLVRNNERYLAFPPAVTPAVSRGIRSRAQFF
jgi:hypothetical protein